MITLYHVPRTRSARFIFLLEELGVPYEIKTVSVRGRDGSGAVDPANPHPHGKVPALSDDGVAVFESAAIALYLTDKFPANGIGPVVGDPLRGAYVSWLAYYAGEMEPAFISKFMNIEAPRPMAGWANADDVMAFINTTLGKSPYLLGGRFSALDILFATTFALFMGSPLLAKTDLLDAYVKRVTGRPAMARAKAKEASLG